MCHDFHFRHSLKPLFLHRCSWAADKGDHPAVPSSHRGVPVSYTHLDVYKRQIDEYLDLESTAENIDMISGVIRQELSGQIKGLGNRLAGLINRLTIISAAGYYANIAIIADLIDRDRYSSFEKIEAAARKEALAFANQKNADALRIFLDDEEMKKAIQAVQGGRRVDPDL